MFPSWFAYIRQVSLDYTTPGSRLASKALLYQTSLGASAILLEDSHPQAIVKFQPRNSFDYRVRYEPQLIFFFFSCVPSNQCTDDSEASDENAQYCEDPSQKCCHKSHHNQLRIERIDFDTFLALINKKSKLNLKRK